MAVALKPKRPAGSTSGARVPFRSGAHLADDAAPFAVLVISAKGADPHVVDGAGREVFQYHIPAAGEDDGVAPCARTHAGLCFVASRAGDDGAGEFEFGVRVVRQRLEHGHAQDHGGTTSGRGVESVGEDEGGVAAAVGIHPIGQCVQVADELNPGVVFIRRVGGAATHGGGGIGIEHINRALKCQGSHDARRKTTAGDHDVVDVLGFFAQRPVG